MTSSIPYAKGPYENVGKHLFFHQGRYYINVKLKNGRWKLTAYARALIEIKLRKLLPRNYHVHHIDGDSTNDEISNLRLIRAGEHLKLHNTIPPEFFKCPTCKKIFTLKGPKLSAWKKRKSKCKSGPYCSRECVYKSQRKFKEFKCPTCKKTFSLQGRNLRAWKRNKKTGPYCSPYCFYNRDYNFSS